jgi:tRNA pseudouridine13 synthase
MAIKRQVEDFIVEETLDAGYLDAIDPERGPFALYRVEKVGLTTHEMLDALARNLHVPTRELAAAGLKDKQAVTTQHLTLRTDALHRPSPREIHSRSVSAQLVGFVDQAITSAAIDSNRFTIVIRTLTRRAIDDLHAAATRLMPEPADVQQGRARLRVTNYYGNQRFGSARAGQGFLAPHLIRGEFEQALRLAIGLPHRKDLLRVKNFKQAVAENWGDWKAALRRLPRLPERAAIEHLARRPTDYRGAFAALPYFFQQLTIEAYQSLLWNGIATHLLIDRLGESGRLWVVDDKFGQIVFPEAQAMPDDLVDLELPVLGRRTELVPPWKDAAERVLAEEGLADVSALKIPGLDKPWFGEVQRKLFMHAERFRVDEPEPDDEQTKARRFKVKTTFTLPRGGYATIVLRALGQ